MIRLLTASLLVVLLIIALREVFTGLDPQRLKPAFWGGLAGALIVAGSWMIASDF